MNILQLVSIFIEFAIVIISLMITLKKKKLYGYGIALTFMIYVFYDLARLFSFAVNDLVLSVLFFIATISMLVSVWKIYKDITVK